MGTPTSAAAHSRTSNASGSRRTDTHLDHAVSVKGRNYIRVDLDGGDPRYQPAEPWRPTG